jgi:hypothetical protein
MKPSVHEDPRIVAAAERQMQAWAHSQEIEGEVLRSHLRQRLAQSARTYVAISREAGAGGGEIAAQLGRDLDWEVLDKGLLDRVAERFHDPRMMLDLVDETSSNWVYDVLGSWMDSKIIPHERYVAHLSRVILAAGRHGKVILVGRGAQFLLPREKGLAVRIVASEKYRIEQMMQRQRLNEADARRLVRQVDEGRRDFVRRFFHRDPADSHLYDLVLNVERLGLTAVVQQIALALCR